MAKIFVIGFDHSGIIADGKYGIRKVEKDWKELRKYITEQGNLTNESYFEISNDILIEKFGFNFLEDDVLSVKQLEIPLAKNEIDIVLSALASESAINDYHESVFTAFTEED